MRAIVLKQTGGAENLTLLDIPQPILKENEVLVEVKAISINPVDYKVRGDDQVLTMIYGEERPAILGWDIAGIVSEVGSEASKFNVGDRVFGMVNFLGAGKGYAEYVASSEDHLALIPDQISYEEAAASTLAALTALQVLTGNVSQGDRVLIHAGSGGVGHFAIQIAKAMGAYVISTSSAKNKEFIMSLGADEHVDYREHAFQDVLSDIDFVFDMFNGEILLNSVKVAREGGRVYSIPSPEFDDEVVELARSKNVQLAFLMVQSSGSDMDIIAKYLEDGTVKAHVSETFAFQDIPKAHMHLESGRTVGKVVIKM